ncbi:MAG: NAD(P)H-dependent glycerol-3-phosphate dehydrogenase [Thermodesulfobacteriota bacterium]|nr:NAD(P)H-dependent glycerol-3-phosphate dehydrogenase [Thermodesulfobacteriota bacterium]
MVFQQQIAVIGAGSWGTALTKLVSDKGVRVRLWGHRREHVEKIRREKENSTYLPGVVLSENVEVVEDIEEAVKDLSTILMVVPSHVYRQVFEKIVPFLENKTIIISATKGIENETLLTMTQVMAEVLEKSGKKADIAVLSGPSFAKEVARQTPTAVTVAAHDEEVVRQIQQIFYTERFRVYGSRDVIGLELGGALKNIIAIAAGICDGLGFGTNTRAALITRGLAEITRLGVKMGADPLTFSGLGGLGDLVLTCTGELSRNRTVGLKLGQGKKLAVILEEMEMVAEGVKTTKSAWALARKQKVEMPILEQIYQVLYRDKSCEEAVHSLLLRDLKEEIYF